jgi:hypothetical protein
MARLRLRQAQEREERLEARRLALRTCQECGQVFETPRLMARHTPFCALLARRGPT